MFVGMYVPFLSLKGSPEGKRALQRKKGGLTNQRRDFNLEMIPATKLAQRITGIMAHWVWREYMREFSLPSRPVACRSRLGLVLSDTTVIYRGILAR